MMERSDPQILGMIGCKRKKRDKREPFPKIALDLCKNSDQFAASAKIVVHEEKEAFYFSRPQNE